jgi:Na+-translocating ferredoxin:NAD+ oxidoreductase RnfD subunit
MPAHKVLIYIAMLIFEIWAWNFIGNGIATAVTSKDKQYEISSDCNCEHEVLQRIKHANISDSDKAKYLTKYTLMNPFEKEFFEKEIKNAPITITYDERVIILTRRISILGITFSFLFTMIFVIVLNQSGGNGHLAPPLCWVVIGIIMLVYYFTGGKKERDAKKRENLHKKISGLTEKFKQFNRMA